MAQSSIFQEFVERIYPQLNLYIAEKTNGSHKQLTYLHKQRLIKVYSPDQKWESSSANTRFVAADMVAMDTPVPLKKRSTVASSNGNLPKIGMKKQMTETDINTVNIMKAQMEAMPEGSNQRKQRYQQILKKIADDAYACSVGIDERNEYNYLAGISNGIVLIEVMEDKGNVGIGMRVNYGYPAANILGSAVKGLIDGDDIERVITMADSKGVAIQHAMVSRSLLTKIRHSRWAAELVADFKNQPYSDATKLPYPKQKSFIEAFEDEYGFTLEVIDRTVLLEKNGKDYPVKPFNPDRMVFLPNATTDGSLVWGTLAEASAPSEAVTYETIDEHKLISRQRITEPSLMELTKGQSLSLPVIEDVDSIFVLDVSKSLEVDASDSTEEGEVDVKITISGKVYKKEAVIDALKNLGSDVKANAKDSTVIRKINELSDEDEARLMEAIKDELYTTSTNG